MEDRGCGGCWTMPVLYPSQCRHHDRAHRHPSGSAATAGPGAGHALRRIPHPLQDHRRTDLPEVREPAVHRVVQGARRLQQAGATDAGRTRARRDRHERGQSCARRGLSRAAARHARRDRDAAFHAQRESGRHPRLRRRDRAARRHAGRGPQPRHGTGAGAVPDFHPSLRRRSGGRRPGNRRTGDAGRRAGAGHAGGGHRRRRADRGHRGGRQGAEAGNRGGRRADAALSEHVQRRQTPGPAAGHQHHRRGHCSRHAGACAAGHHRETRRRHRAGRRGRHRAVDRDAAGDRKDAGRGRWRGRPGRAAEGAATLPRQEGRPGAWRRKHRPAAAGGDHRTRHGACRPAGADPGQRARRAGIPGEDHRDGRRRRRQHRRGAPPARLHHLGGAKRRDRAGAADPRTRAHRRGARRAA